MTVIKHPDQRVGLLIDTQNMYHSAKNIYGARLNFKEILKTAVSGRKLIRAIAYVIKTETGEEKGFFEALKNMGIETRVKDLQVFYGGLKKADWDVGITVDAVKMASRLDVIVLVTGDGDFIPLVEYLKDHGIQVEVIGFAKSASSKLIEKSDEFIDLGESSKKYIIKK